MSCYFCFVVLPLGHKKWCSVNGSVCFILCCVFDSVCELFVRNMFGCDCYFVVECDGVVECGWRCSIG